jgi:hypothetical protein
MRNKDFMKNMKNVPAGIYAKKNLEINCFSSVIARNNVTKQSKIRYFLCFRLPRRAFSPPRNDKGDKLIITLFYTITKKFNVLKFFQFFLTSLKFFRIFQVQFLLKHLFLCHYQIYKSHFPTGI